MVPKGARVVGDPLVNTCLSHGHGACHGASAISVRSVFLRDAVEVHGDGCAVVHLVCRRDADCVANLRFNDRADHLIVDCCHLLLDANGCAQGSGMDDVKD